jgi:hypothetical protein
VLSIIYFVACPSAYRGGVMAYQYNESISRIETMKAVAYVGKLYTGCQYMAWQKAENQ